MIHTNPATADLLGTSVAGLEPGSILENTGPEDGPALSRLIADAKTDKPPREIELDVRTQDGRSIPVAIRACLIAFAEQNATYLLVRDVTESKRGDPGGEQKTQGAGSAEIGLPEHRIPRVENTADVDQVVNGIPSGPQQELG